MDEFDAMEIVRNHWVETSENLPSQQVLMVTCPFCGKSDRVKVIPSSEGTDKKSVGEYREALQLLSEAKKSVAICGFCLNVVLVRAGRAEPVGMA